MKGDSIENTATAILLSAMNDWPNETSDFNIFESEVRSFIGGAVTRQKISAKKIDYAVDAWKSESLTQITALLDLFDNKLSLKEIINLLDLQ